MNYTERAFTFDCSGETIFGFVAIPKAPKKTGVLIAVGGPQYRVGSHRQFVLLSRALAEAGYPCLRFDYRGMGDSTGEMQNFEKVSVDFGAAIDAFQSNCPTVENFVLWGLCDAASAILLYCDVQPDSRVNGLVLLNPWVRSEASLANVHIKHYYGQRLLQAEFWGKLLTGKLGIVRALGGFIGSVKNARQNNNLPDLNPVMPFQSRMAHGFEVFKGQVLVLLSGNDFTAKEFQQATQTEQIWSSYLIRNTVTKAEIPQADHTFSSAEWRGQVENITRQWLDSRVDT